MKKKAVLKAVCDGFFQGVLFYVLVTFVISEWAIGFSLGHYFVISAICSIVFAFVYYFNVRQFKDVKTLIRASAISFITFLFSVLAGFVYCFVFPFRIFPVAGDDAGYGFVVIFVSIAFAAFTVVARLTVLLSMIIRNKKQTF